MKWGRFYFLVHFFWPSCLDCFSILSFKFLGLSKKKELSLNENEVEREI
jgi:hypothetical protein